MPSSYTSPFPSTPSLVSVNTTTSTSSTTPLRRTSESSSSSSTPSSSSHSPSSQPMQKDFSKSFGLLQSQYGWGPTTFVPVHVQSRTENTETKKNRRKERDMRSRSVQKEQGVDRGSETRGKDYQSVFGSLSSRYGFGGSWPTPSKKSKEHT